MAKGKITNIESLDRALSPQEIYLLNENGILYTQLKKHGGHTADCAAEGVGEGMWHGKCDCGWAEIEKGRHYSP